MRSQPRPPSIADSESGSNGRSHQGTNQQDFANLDFITTPTREGFSSRPISAMPLERTDTAMTDASNMTERRPSNFWDFMNIGENKSIVQMTNRESVKPIAQVTALFVLWGFAYGLLNSLNEQIQRVTNETTNQGIGTHSAYYVGYFLAPVTFGRIVLKRWGFKACYQVGLAIYGTGTLIFWPSAVVASFPGFLVCNFVIGLGLATLEVAANPFIVLCGPSEYGEMRLQLSQAFQACGTVVSHVWRRRPSSPMCLTHRH